MPKIPKIPKSFLLLTFASIQGGLFYWLSLIPVPNWEKIYQLIGYSGILVGLLLAAYILLHFWQQHQKRHRIIWAIAYFILSAILAIYFGVLAIVLNLSSVEGFMCSVARVNSVEFPNYRSTIYLINLSCIPDGHSSVYVQTSWLPVMQQIGYFNSPFDESLDPLDRNNEIVKIFGSNGVIYYDLKTKKSWKW